MRIADPLLRRIRQKGVCFMQRDSREAEREDRQDRGPESGMEDRQQQIVDMGSSTIRTKSTVAKSSLVTPSRFSGWSLF